MATKRRVPGMGGALETVAEGMTQWSLKYSHLLLLTIFFSINKAFYYGCLPHWLPPAMNWDSMTSPTSVHRLGCGSVVMV